MGSVGVGAFIVGAFVVGASMGAFVGAFVSMPDEGESVTGSGRVTKGEGAGIRTGACHS